MNRSIIACCLATLVISACSAPPTAPSLSPPPVTGSSEIRVTVDPRPAVWLIALDSSSSRERAIYGFGLGLGDTVRVSASAERVVFGTRLNSSGWPVCTSWQRALPGAVIVLTC